MSAYDDLNRLVSFRPLERPIECSYKVSPFRAAWPMTVRQLAQELHAHGAVGAILEIDYREQDLRQDGIPRADRRAQTPGIVLSFKATSVAGQPDLRYEVGTFVDWTDNVRAVALGLNALRAVDRHGVTKRGEQYAGWKQLAAGTGAGEGDPKRGKKLVDAAGSISKALFEAHPDHGGEDNDFRDVIAYRDSRS